jgi:hypothetical protein
MNDTTQTEFYETSITHDDLVVRDDGLVTGAVLTEVKQGYHVEGSVTSYKLGEFSRHDMNHEPSVVVLNTSSHVVTDVCVNASPNPHRAIGRTWEATRYAYRKLDKMDDQ